MLINKQAVRQAILAECERSRPGWPVTRVSGPALAAINAKVRVLIKRAVEAHPSNGKTFDQVI